ncbi:MAG: nitroreductase family protein [Gaiellaceae bacterium]
METFETIRKRCSLKTHLSKKPIEPEKTDLVLDAARLAPSARNLQPWRFVLVQGDEAIDELVLGAFPDSNQVMKEASLLIVICARQDDDLTVDRKPYYLFDTGLAVENLLLAATDLGLVTHPVLRFDESEVKRILEIPREYRVILVTPLAYPAEPSYDEAAEERLRERTRKDLGEITHYGKWGS